MYQTLYERLKAYGESDYYGFHMPGHKRNHRILGAAGETFPYGMDITEIDGFDNLHHCEGILKEGQERAAKLFCAEETHFLVNGSTVGILSAIAGCTRRGDKILVSRHCHKSVYHAIELLELQPSYVYPKRMKDSSKSNEINGEVKKEDIAQILREEPEIKAVVIVSPTYEGVVSDIRGIAQVVHDVGIPLIVDEAHGSHFGFHPYFPENANVCGADVVIHSLHKTLPAFTQTALLHLNGEIVDRERICRYLQMFETSSPSYLLMAGLDWCVQLLLEKGDALFEQYVNDLERTRQELGNLKQFSLEEPQDKQKYDRGKLVLVSKNRWFNGKNLADQLLNEYHLQMEMSAGTYALAMTSIGDTKEGFDRLIQAMQEIDAEAENREQDAKSSKWVHERLEKEEPTMYIPQLEQVYTSACVQDIDRTCRRSVRWEDSVGCVSMEYAYLYPPGTPLMVPGERISKEVIEILKEYRRMGYAIEGLQKQEAVIVVNSHTIMDCDAPETREVTCNG